MENNIDLLKSKITSHCLMATIDRWNINEAIYISVKKSNMLYMNNPKLRCDQTTVDNLLEVDMTDINIDMFKSNIEDFLLHFIIHNQVSSYSCALFADCCSSMEKLLNTGGLHPISQESILIGGKDICIFDYEGFSRNLSLILGNEDLLNDFLTKQGQLIAENFQKNNKLFLKGRGFIVVGLSVEQCWYIAFQMIYAIETQVKIVDLIGSDSIVVPTIDVQNQVRLSDLKGHSKQLYINSQGDIPNINDGELEFEANTRLLEDLGLKTRCDERHSKIWNYKFNQRYKS